VVANRSRRPLFIAAAAALVAAVVLGTLAVGQFTAGRGPAAVVRQYYEALSHADAARALAFAATPATGLPAEYLTSTVLAKQLRLAPMRDITVGTVSGSGASRQVAIRYVLAFADGPQTVSDTVAVSERGTTWQLSTAAVGVTVGSSSAGADRISFAGRSLPQKPVGLFPGALPLATDSAAVAITGHPSVRLGSGSAEVSVTAALTGSAQRRVTDALQVALTKCLAMTSADPLCPNVTGGRPVPGSLHGSLTKQLADSNPSVTLSRKGGGIVAVSVDAQLNANWKVWDFNNQQVPRKEQTTVKVRCLSSVSDPNTIYWPGPGA
jgi:hypothetical protein